MDGRLLPESIFRHQLQYDGTQQWLALWGLNAAEVGYLNLETAVGGST